MVKQNRDDAMKGDAEKGQKGERPDSMQREEQVKGSEGTSQSQRKPPQRQPGQLPLPD